MPWRGPNEPNEYPTLGWLVIDWIEHLQLPVPAGHPDLIGRPLELTNSQMGYFLMWYRLNEDGTFYYANRGQDVGPKGCGKSPEGALTCLTEFDGPAVFAGWDANGEPVGKNRVDSVVSIIGVAEVQTGNMYDWLFTALANSKAADEYGWSVELGRISKARGGFGVIETATSSVSTTGRARHFVAKEETWLWTPSSGMVKQSALINADVQKTHGRTCEYTNSPTTGTGTVAELTQIYSLTSRRPIMIHRRSAAEDLPPDLAEKGIRLKKNEPRVRELIRIAYGDSLVDRGGWMQEDDAYEGILDPEATEDDGYRLWLAIERKGTGRMVDPDTYDVLALPDKIIEPGSLIVLSFDGSMVKDSTALLATTIEARPHQTVVRIWKRPAGAEGEDWVVPKHEVKDAVHDWFHSHRVMMMVADYAGKWESTLDEFGDAWGRLRPTDVGKYGTGLIYPIWWNNNYVDVDRICRKYDSLLSAVDPENPTDLPWSHDGDPLLRNQVCAMITSYQQRGKYMCVETESEAPDHMIDAGVASMMGIWAALKMFALYGSGVQSGDEGLSTWQRLTGSADAEVEDDSALGAARRLRDITI